MNADASLCLLDECLMLLTVMAIWHCHVCMCVWQFFCQLLLHHFTLLFLSLWYTISHHSMKPAFREPWYTSVKYRIRNFSYMPSFRRIFDSFEGHFRMPHLLCTNKVLWLNCYFYIRLIIYLLSMFPQRNFQIIYFKLSFNEKKNT